ncbi:MAG TPA: ABC transporter ATP-binding protein [Mycobacteriales bacterium]|jgi:peptide/nickel transport system ATP-binding protein|nr:ABC transporter ATP-binding protein [Mycobacteriales bacterium]
MSTQPLLEVKGLKTQYTMAEGVVRAVDGVDLRVSPGETLCVVGESGCGKSVTARSILQLVDAPGKIVDGQILFDAGENHVATQSRKKRKKDDLSEALPAGTVDIAKLDPRGEQIRAIRGKEISMIFQEPMSSLSPVHTIGNQIIENILLHEQLTKKEARERAIEELRHVGIPRPEERVDSYTFQLSGGMRQRAMIAMALACRPKLLIADEPTTALDVTTQAQILELLQTLQEQLGMAIIFITHDLGVVAEIADRVSVMYLGLVVEDSDVDSIFHSPQHPYTQALLRSLPMVGKRSREHLATIRGMVPHPYNRPPGCPFHTRCDKFIPGHCDTDLPLLIERSDPANPLPRAVRCVLYDEAEMATVDGKAS